MHDIVAIPPTVGHQWVLKAGGALAPEAEKETGLSPFQLYLQKGWACLSLAKSKAIKTMVMTSKTNALKEGGLEDTGSR